MSNKKISQFQVVTTLNGTTYVPVIQGSPLFDAIISASNFAASMQDYNDNYYIKVDGTNSDIEYLNFNPDAVGDPQPYVRKWSATDGTFVFGLPDGGIIQEGKELFDYYVNADTVPLVNGDVVSIVPISGNRKAIARTNVTNAQSAKNAIGMVTVASIAVGATGRVTKFGEVHDLLTSLYPDGTELFVSESNAGKWATVGATPPNYTVKIGTVIVSQNGNGIVELGIQCFPKLGDLSDVNGVSSSVNKPIVRKADGVIDAIDNLTLASFSKTGSSDAEVLLGGGGSKTLQSIYDTSAGVVAQYADQAEQAAIDAEAAKLVAQSAQDAAEAAQLAAESAEATALANNELLGGIAYNAAAPTPGKSGKYSFTTGGTCTWLTGGAATVSVGDEVVVVFTAPSTYTYTKVGRPDIEQVRSQSTSKVPSSKIMDDELKKIDSTYGLTTDNSVNAWLKEFYLSNIDGSIVGDVTITALKNYSDANTLLVTINGASRLIYLDGRVNYFETYMCKVVIDTELFESNVPSGVDTAVNLFIRAERLKSFSGFNTDGVIDVWSINSATYNYYMFQYISGNIYIKASNNGTFVDFGSVLNLSLLQGIHLLPIVLSNVIVGYLQVNVDTIKLIQNNVFFGVFDSKKAYNNTSIKNWHDSVNSVNGFVSGGYLFGSKYTTGLNSQDATTAAANGSYLYKFGYRINRINVEVGKQYAMVGYIPPCDIAILESGFYSSIAFANPSDLTFTTAGSGKSVNKIVTATNAYLYTNSTVAVYPVSPAEQIITIAASNASEHVKKTAKYVCTGVNDNIIINTAIQSLPAWGGEIKLSNGLFNVSAPIVIDRMIKLSGEGHGIAGLPAYTPTNGITYGTIDGIYIAQNLYGRTVGVTTIRASVDTEVIRIGATGDEKLQIIIRDMLVQGYGRDRSTKAGIYALCSTDISILQNVSVTDAYVGACLWGKDANANMDAMCILNCSFQQCGCGLIFKGIWCKIYGNCFADNISISTFTMLDSTVLNVYSGGMWISGGTNRIESNEFVRTDTYIPSGETHRSSIVLYGVKNIVLNCMFSTLRGRCITIIGYGNAVCNSQLQDYGLSLVEGYRCGIYNGNNLTMILNNRIGKIVGVVGNTCYYGVQGNSSDKLLISNNVFTNCANPIDATAASNITQYGNVTWNY